MKTITKNTHIAKIRQHNREGMQQVCHLLQCTEQDYCDYLFDQYCFFVQERYKAFPEVVLNRILYSSLFRGMFNNAAAQRDETEFIPQALDVTEDVTIINIYGRLEVLQTVPLGGQYLIEEWHEIHSYKRLLEDNHFLNQFEHTLELISKTTRHGK
ncbi:hypothetical protein [Pedobacter sp. NJ-S-72]